MRAKIIRIGNSRGIRLPKPILEASGITDEADVTVEDGRIILLRPPKRPREGWAEAIEAIGPDNEDWSDWQNLPNEFDETEWTWPEDAIWPTDISAMPSTSSTSNPSEGPKSPNVDVRDRLAGRNERQAPHGNHRSAHFDAEKLS